MHASRLSALALLLAASVAGPLLPGVRAEQAAKDTRAPKAAQKPATSPAKAPGAPAGVTPPPGYVLGADDVLIVMFWREKEMSAEVAVRPDGMIALPLLNDVKAEGLTVEQLRQQVEKLAAEFVKEPSATVVVKQINSRRVFVTGNVTKAGIYPLTGAMTVLQAIAAAGGLNEYADEKSVSVMRVENGQTRQFKFNYKDVTRGKHLEQNIELRPGDTVVVR
jgi:polysaccharide biosynthesis/export protein